MLAWAVGLVAATVSGSDALGWAVAGVAVAVAAAIGRRMAAGSGHPARAILRTCASAGLDGRILPMDEPQSALEHGDRAEHEDHEGHHAHLEVDRSERDQHPHHEGEVDEVLPDVRVHHLVVDVSLHDQLLFVG
jgi:hypothetical protein